MTIEIKTPYVSTNALYTNSRTTGRKILTDKARILKEAIAWEAKAQIGARQPFTGTIRVEIYLYFVDKRKRDIDNIKSLIDALTGVCWKDDSQIYELVVRKYHDKENPRAKIIIQRL